VFGKNWELLGKCSTKHRTSSCRELRGETPNFGGTDADFAPSANTLNIHQYSQVSQGFAEHVCFPMVSCVTTWGIYVYSLLNSHIYGKSQCLMGKSTISMAIFNSYVSHYQRLMDNINNHKDQQNCDSLHSEDHRRAKLAIPSPNYQTPWIFLIRNKKSGAPCVHALNIPQPCFFFCRGIKGMCFSKWYVCIA